MPGDPKPRFDHVGVIVENLDAAVAFFVALGFEADERMAVGGPDVGRIIGLDDPQSEIVMVTAPDGSGRLELITYHAPHDAPAEEPAPANRPGFRHVAIEVEDVGAAVERARADGYETVGDTVDYGGTYRLVYVRGPEGLIVELAERLSGP